MVTHRESDRFDSGFDSFPLARFDSLLFFIPIIRNIPNFALTFVRVGIFPVITLYFIYFFSLNSILAIF